MERKKRGPARFVIANIEQKANPPNMSCLKFKFEKPEKGFFSKFQGFKLDDTKSIKGGSIIHSDLETV